MKKEDIETITDMHYMMKRQDKAQYTKLSDGTTVVLLPTD